MGYDDAGLLTEKIRKKPYSIILFDEIEKAHKDVFNLLLQILDDGILTDSHGRTVRFYNAIIVMTTNAGSETKSTSLGFNSNDTIKSKEKVNEALKTYFRPEFLNRVDSVVVFDPLTKTELEKIAGIMLERVKEALAVKKLHMSWTDNVTDYLVKNGFSDKYGARPLRRLIEKEIEDKIADMYIISEIKEGDSFTVDCENDKIEIKI